MEIRSWEQKSSEIALLETRELESQRLQMHQANQVADQPQREKISLCGELEMINRLFKKIAQELARQLKNNEEFVAKKQIEQDNLEFMNYLCSRKGIPLL